MKKALFALATLGGLVSFQAQKSIPFSNGLKVENHAVDFSKKRESYKRLLPKSSLNQFSNAKTPANFAGKGFQAQNLGVTPSGSISAFGWKQLISVDDNSKQLIQEDYVFGNDAHVSLKFLNPDTKLNKELTLALPSTANFYSILSETSNFNFNGNTKMKFLMFAHYFEGGMGPEYQKTAVWMYDEDGTVLKKFENTSDVKFVKNTDDTTSIYTYNDDETTVDIAVYDQNLESISSKTYGSELFLFFSGSPISFIKINGQEKMVVARYEKLFMDNATLEVTPDNHLVIEIYDQNLNLEKQTNIALPAYEQDSYIFGLAEFAVFYGDNKYEITQNVFNSDSNLEFLYGIAYQDLMQDNSWTNYFVADEQGNTLKSLEDRVVTFIPMKEIAGQDDQMSFITTDEEGNQAIKMFDIASWQTATDFTAEYNGELLSSNYNRIPFEDSYQYLIGLGEPLLQGDNYYGVINKYSPTGEFSGKVKLNIGTDPLGFTPLLYDDILESKVFDNDNELEYNYVYRFQYPGDQNVYNSFNVADETGGLIFTVNGNQSNGNVTGSGFLVDTNDKPYKLGVIYGESSQSIKTTEFFDIPFLLLSTSNAYKSTIKSYTDKSRQIIGFSEKLASYKVYNMLGMSISSGKSTNEISTSGWANGIYLVQYITHDNKIEVVKILVQ